MYWVYLFLMFVVATAVILGVLLATQTDNRLYQRYMISHDLFAFHTNDSKDYIFPIQYKWIQENMPFVKKIHLMVDADCHVNYKCKKPEFDFNVHDVEIHLVHPTASHPSDRHAEVLNAAKEFTSDKPTWFFDGDLFPIKHISVPNGLYFRSQRKNEQTYLWPGLIYFPEFPKAIDFSTSPGFDTGGMTRNFLQGYQDKYIMTDLESKIPKNSILQEWFEEYNLLEIDNDEQFAHVRNLTSNWKKRDIARDITTANYYLDLLHKSFSMD